MFERVEAIVANFERQISRWIVDFGGAPPASLAEKLVAELGEDPAVWLPEFHRIRKGALA